MTVSPIADAWKESGQPASPATTVKFTEKPNNAPLPDLKVPVTEPEKFKAKHRISTLIAQHAGAHWRQAQQTRWLVNLILQIENEYKDVIAQQAVHVTLLQSQVEQLQESQQQQQRSSQQTIDELQQRLRWQEGQLHSTAQLNLQLQERLRDAESALSAASQAAAQATEDVAQFHTAVQVLSETDARRRKTAAHQRHQLREALLAANSRLRQCSTTCKKERLEAAVSVRELQLHQERQLSEMTQQLDGVLLEARHEERQAAEYALHKLQLEMEGYKDAWEYDRAHVSSHGVKLAPRARWKA